MSMHRTAGGKLLDMNALKIQQEQTIAVGNSRTNARGDVLGTGGQVVKTRDEIMKEFYNQQKGNKIARPLASSGDEAIMQAQADMFAAPASNGIDQITQVQEQQPELVTATTEATNININEALAKSQELAARLKSSRNRI
jgi:hypothetical protein